MLLKLKLLKGAVIPYFPFIAYRTKAQTFMFSPRPICLELLQESRKVGKEPLLMRGKVAMILSNNELKGLF